MKLDDMRAKATVAGRSAKKWTIRLAIGIPILAAAFTALEAYVAIHYTYSEGERIGVVQKLATKGWFCKTTEGELMMTRSPGQLAQMFEFTVPDDAVKKQIQDLESHQVRLSYKQHAQVPWTCFGDTVYYVTGVSKVN